MAPKWWRRPKGSGPAEAFLERRSDAHICWWCEAEATTAEHKFKQTDLRRLKGDDDFFYHYVDGDPNLGRVNGINSKRVKFRKNLCGPCNNARSQPFDRAYTTFSTYVHDNIASIYSLDALDMNEVFAGSDARIEIYNLTKYFMKYFGCRIDDSGYQVPKQISRFCDDGTFMPNIEIAFFRDRALNLYNEISGAAGIGAFPLYHSGIVASVLPENDMLPVTLYGESIIGNIGVMYGWNARQKKKPQPFYRYRRALLTERRDMPLPELYAEWPEYLREYRQYV